MKVTTGLEWIRLCEQINSPTLQRDINFWRETGETPSGYTQEEIILMREYLLED